MKIVVLCGGLSPERNVSRSSGAMIAAALRELGHAVVLTDMYFGLEDYEGSLENIFDNPPEDFGTAIGETAPDMEAVRAARRMKTDSQFGDRVLELCAMADIVFMALHGQCGEDGRVQAVFDLLGIKYTGSGHLGSAIAMDKDLTKRIVAPLGILTPEWRVYELKGLDIEAACAECRLPAVVKPVDSGSSIGVSIAHTEDELRSALKAAAGESSRAVVEQYISGREVQIGILAGKPLPSIEIRPLKGFYDYKNKYQAGAAEEITPAPIPEETEQRLAQSALTVYNALGLSAISRADFILDGEGRLWFLEINTLPGMTPTSLVPQEAAVLGISYPELCQRIIDASMEKYL
ncbi:MAG TPA: D-alanine--D-alanine ligase [Candidatus Scatomorpha intestinavium]|uniref:D-alanine--D-alanine ligase n=1 Tax=Candidatus Scatomorpha intestinavium TaxID=2840922 RepID=A0A9D1CUM8_9FIRM|nr:D-alanine--D-alanine ligase [Candidatus Scatomorpha intestinavium]